MKLNWFRKVWRRIICEQKSVAIIGMQSTVGFFLGGGGWHYSSRHFLFLFLTGGGQRTARIASSKTVLRPRWVSAEHSRYFTAPTGQKPMLGGATLHSRTQFYSSGARKKPQIKCLKQWFSNLCASRDGSHQPWPTYQFLLPWQGLGGRWLGSASFPSVFQ